MLEPDLVDLESLGLENLQLDIRYATDNNFVGQAVYKTARAFLQRDAAVALAKVHEKCKELNLGLIVYDCYRPLAVTVKFYELTPDHLREFVANPATGSKHNRGCAIDLSLYDLTTGLPLEMPCDFDCFDFRAHSAYAGAAVDVDPAATAATSDNEHTIDTTAATSGAPAQDSSEKAQVLEGRIRNRDQLRRLMEAGGDFKVQYVITYTMCISASLCLHPFRLSHLPPSLNTTTINYRDNEWWHFDYKHWQQYAVLDVAFEDIVSS